MKAISVVSIAVIAYGLMAAAVQGQSSRIRDDRDGTFTDTTTGLTWIREYKKEAKNFEEAKAICKALKYAKHGDWRLPTSTELVEIIRYLRSSKTSGDFVALKETDKLALYWTSSEHVQDPKKEGGLVLQTDRPMVQTVNPQGNVVIHGGAETGHTYVIPVRGRKK
ncbi:MAG: DUF1566 domain-containing protein [Deltaproteobacteria bacterium]|nr:DUF1566 domain-containing protein [Deltaproteobacteria bacterium]